MTPRFGFRFPLEREIHGGGSGELGGYFRIEEMAQALQRGYATSATDDGHSDRGSRSHHGPPRKRGLCLPCRARDSVEAKILIKTFYGREARYSYWNGCSGGGREGLLQAYRYPDEFNGMNHQRSRQRGPQRVGIVACQSNFQGSGRIYPAYEVSDDSSRGSGYVRLVSMD